MDIYIVLKHIVLYDMMLYDMILYYIISIRGPSQVPIDLGRQHTELAFDAAIAQQLRLADLREQWLERGWPILRVRMGRWVNRVYIESILYIYMAQPWAAPPPPPLYVVLGMSCTLKHTCH